MRSRLLNAIMLMLGLGVLWGSQQTPAQAPGIPPEVVPPLVESGQTRAPEPLPPPLQLSETPPGLLLPGEPQNSGPALPSFPAAPPPRVTTSAKAPRLETSTRPPAFRILVPTDPGDPYLVKPPAMVVEKTTSHFGPNTTAAQLPALTLEKIGPSSIRAREAFTYEIVVRNVGTSPAPQIRVEDELPPGTRFLEAAPACVQQNDRLHWTVENLAAGGERRMRVDVLPMNGAEWKGQATLTVSVTSGLQASVGNAATALPSIPALTFSLTGPKSVALGHAATFQLQVSNPGDRAVSGLQLRVELPAGLEHLHGNAIEADLGALAAGQSRQVPIELYATKTGRLAVDAWVATADRREHVRAEVTVSESGLLIRHTGPARLVAESVNEYRIEVVNREKTDLRKVMVTNYLPEGMELVNLSEGGMFQPTSRSVQWSLGTIPAGQSRLVALKMAGKSPGSFVNRIQTTAENRPETLWHAIVRVVPASHEAALPSRQVGKNGR